MANWYDEEVERLTKERDIALFRHYDKLVADGELSDSEAEFKAFVKGWFATYAFDRAKKERNEAGDPSGAMILWLFGGFLTAIPGLILVLAYNSGDPLDVYWSRVTIAFIIGLVLLSLGFLANKRAGRKARAGISKFKDEWGEKPKTAVDEPDEMS